MKFFSIDYIELTLSYFILDSFDIVQEARPYCSEDMSSDEMFDSIFIFF